MADPVDSPRLSPSGPRIPGGGGATPTLEQVLTESNDAGGIPIENLGPPTFDDDAATKEYVDDAIAGALTQDLEDVLTTGNSAGLQRIEDLGGPVVATDAANKQYTDQTAAGFLGLEQVSSGNHTFDDTELGVLFESNDSSPQIFTLPPTVGDPKVGKVFAVTQGGTGLASFAPGVGVTIQGGLTDCTRQYGIMFAVIKGPNTYSTYGEVE